MLRALGQLAARELGLAQSTTALAPRLPSRYEHTDAGANAPHDAATADVATPREMRETVPVSDAAAISTDRSSMVVPTDVHRDAIESTAQPARAEAHAAFDPHEAIHHARSSSKAHDNALPTPVVAQAISQHSPALPRDDARPASKAIEEQPLMRSSVRPVEHTEAVHTQASKPRAALPRETSTLRPLPLPPPIARAPSKPATTAPVQITIGRLEIRASKEPAAPTAAPSRSSVSPSLSTYLRRRSEGGRS